MSEHQGRGLVPPKVTPVLPHPRTVSLDSLVAVPSARIRVRSNDPQKVWAAHELESRLSGDGRLKGKTRDTGHADASHPFRYSQRDDARPLHVSGALFETAPASSWRAGADVGGGGGPEAARAAAQVAAAAAAKAIAAAMAAKETSPVGCKIVMS